MRLEWLKPKLSFTFEYVKESDVYVSVDDVVKTKDTHYTFAPNTSSITFFAGSPIPVTECGDTNLPR